MVNGRQPRWAGGGTRRLIHESGGHQLVEEEFDVGQLRVPDSEGTEQADVPALNGHEHTAQVLQVGAHQVQGLAEVFQRLTLWERHGYFLHSA